MSSLTDLSKSILEIDLKKLSKKNLIELVLEPTYTMNNAYNTTRSKWLTDLNVPNDLEELTRSELAKLILLNKSIRHRKCKTNLEEKTRQFIEFFHNVHFVYKTYFDTSDILVNLNYLKCHSDEETCEFPKVTPDPDFLYKVYFDPMNKHPNWSRVKYDE